MYHHIYILSNCKSVLHKTHNAAAAAAALRSLQLRAAANDSRSHQGEIRSALSAVAEAEKKDYYSKPFKWI